MEKINSLSTKKRDLKIQTVVYNEIEVHCICRTPELKNVAMIECSLCLKWYHALCIDVDLSLWIILKMNGSVQSVTCKLTGYFQSHHNHF